MRKTMGKLTQGATRLLVLALGLGLVSTVWAAASLEETGATVPTTATLAFKGATLSQVTASALSGVMGGDWAGAVAGNAMTFNNFDRTSEASGTITCQAQIQHDTNVKGVLLTFTQDGDNVNVTKTGAKYIENGTVGQSIVGGTDVSGHYDVSKLKLTLGKPTPIAVFDGASGGFKKTSINGVTFAANGNTVADDGSYVKISASVGALFKLSQGYSYVVGEFTVTNLNESAAADRVLALWSPAEDGTSTASPGVLLKSGTVDTRGVWHNALWGDDQTTLNGSLATGISTDALRTFALATEDSNNNNYPGTHLFELTGANPGTAVYGGTGNMGLRGAQTYRTLAIGGPATGSLSAMTDLVITKVVIYASDSRQFTSTDPTTIADVENPAAFYVGNGETINASAINAGVTASGAAYVYTEAGATLNLDAELMGRATFSGSISGVPVSTIGLTLGSKNDKVTLTNASYDHVFKGTGTVVYPDNTIPSASAIWLKSSDWAGTLSLNNIQGSNNTQPGWYAPFHNYGSANSTIKVSGFTGFFGAGNFESSATLEIAAGSTFTLNNGNNGNSMTFAKLKGSGNIVICGDNGPAIQYVMRDASEFAGNITVSQSGSSTFKKSIVLGGGSSYNYSTGKYQKQICVLGNVTIAAGKTWTADSGIVVDGTLTLAASDSSMPAVASGTGKIACNNKVPNNSGLTASTWTGTLEINADTTSGTISGSTQFMNAASKLNLAEGYLSFTGVSELPGEVSVASGAILYLRKTDATTASVKVGTLGGAISTQFATSLETLTLDLGAARTFDWTKINQGNNQNLTVNISLTEVSGENGTTVFTPANFNANNTYNYTIKHIDGTAISATPVINGETGVVTFTYVPQVDGDACWHAYEFNSTYTSSNVHYYPDSVSTDQRDCRTWDYADPDLYTDPDKTDNKFIYTIICPGPNKAYDYPTEWSAAIRCTTPSTANSIIVAFGNSNAGNYIALVSGDTAGKVRLVSGSGSNPVGEITSMTVANPTTSQHVYVFTKTASAVTVYCDGDLIVTKPLSLTIGSGFQFGTIYGGTQNGCGLSRVSSRETAGMVDYTRLYDFAISSDMIQKLAADDQYESTTPTYSREVSGSPWWHTGEGTWLKSDDSTLVGVPDVAGIVDLTATADATMTVNLPAAPVYEKLTFQGAGAVTLVKNGNSPKIATAKLVVKTNVTAPYDIADFSGARISVDAGKVLTFDFSTYPLENVTGVTTQQVTGVTTRADDRYAVAASTKPAWNSNLSLVYDPVEYVYSVVIDPAALVTKNNTTVAYPTVAAALTALSTDAGTVRLLVNYDQDITLSAGQTLDVGSTTYSGTASATGQYAELVHSGTTWKAVDNSVNTWKSSVTTGEWNTASNWENGVIPKTYTRVTFPANDDPEFTGYTVGVRLSGNYDAGWTPVCTGMVVNAKVDMVQGESSSDWGTIHLGGNISGEGTLALHKIGLYNALGSSTPITVSCGLSVAIKDAANQDCYLYGGPFVFDGAVTATSNVLFKAESCAATFNGTVTMENGTTINGNGTGTTVYNGGISVPADAAATLEGSGRVTIASTVTLASGATLTVPNATTVSGSTFATSVADSYVKATAGESTTVYSVAAKRAATVSVGTNAALSINGNAVADGDTLKFVPDDVLTITASADTYYTPALTVNGVAQTSPYELTTTDADVTVSVTATLDTYTITIPVVANTTVSVSYTSGGAAQVATTAGDITVDAGTDVTANWTAASGYKITSGASQTLNAVTSAQTLASPTVEAMGATVSDVSFSYGADYATATVTATVTGDATSATLSYGNATYNTNVVNGTVTFENVAVTRGNDIYAPAGYTITAKDGETAVTTTGGSGTSVAADVVAVGWINENAETSGTSAGGSWTNAVTYANGKAEIGDNRFEATTASTASRVVLEFNVCFSSASDADVEGEAQAAIKLGESGGATTFMVLASNAAWTPVSRGDFVPDASTTYKVVMTIDYGNGSYGVTVGDNVLTNASGSASFPLAKSGATSVKNIDFAGSGTLTSMKGDQVEGYMVKDNAGNWYATIQAATQAYNSANGPYTVLHDGTPPDGWKIDEATKALIKLAKGFFFMAY